MRNGKRASRFRALLLPVIAAVWSGCAAPRQRFEVREGALGSSKFLVPFTLNGELRTFHLDTGAASSFVNWDAGTQALPVVGSVGSSGTSGIRKTGDRVRVRELRIGDLAFPDVAIGRYRDARKDNLGNDLWRGRVVELRFSTRELVFPRSAPSYPVRTPMELLDDSHIRISASYAGRPIKAVFDTGAELSSFDSAYVNANPDLFEFVQDVTGGKDVNGRPMTMKLYKTRGLELEGRPLPLDAALSFDFGTLREYFGPDTPLILGANSIRAADWVLDFRDRTVGFKPGPRP